MSTDTASSTLALLEENQQRLLRLYREHADALKSLQALTQKDLLPSMVGAMEVSREHESWCQMWLYDTGMRFSFHVSVIRALMNPRFIV